MFRICSLLLTGLWMLLIFWFSSQTGEESGGISACISEPITQLLCKILGSVSAEKEANLYVCVDGAVRTMAHFSEYAILGLLLKLVFLSFDIRNFAMPAVSGILYALTDEWHQSFSPGRVCDLLDVLVDGCGILFGILIYSFIKYLWRRRYVHNQ